MGLKTKITLHGFKNDFEVIGKEAEDLLNKLDAPLTDKEKEALEKARNVYKQVKQR